MNPTFPKRSIWTKFRLMFQPPISSTEITQGEKKTRLVAKKLGDKIFVIKSKATH